MRLSVMIRHCYYVQVICDPCNRSTTFDPRELLVMFGDHDLNTLRKRFKCKVCGRKMSRYSNGYSQELDPRIPKKGDKT